MNPQRRRRLQEILDTPLPIGHGGPTSLREVVAGDQKLLRDLATTLTQSGEIEPEVSEPTGVEPEALAPGDRVGPYRIDGLLGRGGMGVVYLATRTDDFEQKVALKVVGSGQRTVEILRRFYRERQILADLQHPHIARLFDGGSTSDAWPYLVMEYVDGEPIDRYCDDRSLSLDRRLALFRKVCAAVHFAHQSLVVHRDLKPGNILVTPEGDPKLLDFGIAKLLEPAAGPGGGEVGAGKPHHPMTPAFASPEQFTGDAVTTVSDVYSLGVLLYWLTAGRPPYKLGELDPVSRIRAVCIDEPSPPSIAVLDSAGDGTRRRAKRLAGDIDAIVRKAMRKTPAERYGSAAQLADDIQRHLDDLPVVARDGTWRYHASKLARRHKPALALLLTIIAFAITSTVLWRQAVTARAAALVAAEHAEGEAVRAQAARARSQSVAGFLEDLFTAADPDATGGSDVSVRQILDRGRDRISNSLAASPELRADMLGTLGTVYNNLGDLVAARELKLEALELRRQSGSSDRPALAIDLNNLARLHSDLGDPAAAEPLLREALTISQRLGDEERVDVAMVNLAGVLTHLGEGDEAIGLHRQVLDRRRERKGHDHVLVASSLYSLGIAEFSNGRFEPAEAHLRQALDLYRATHGDAHTRVASVQGNLGLVLHARGRLGEARAAFEACLATRRQLLGDDHVSVATVRKNLGALLLDLGDVAGAEDLLRPALDSLRRQRTRGDWALAQAEGVWASYLAATGRFDDAEALLIQSLEILERVKGEQDVFARDARARLDQLRRARTPAVDGSG